MRKILLLLFTLPVMAWAQQIVSPENNVATQTVYGDGERTVKSPVVINPGNPLTPSTGVAKEYLFQEIELGTTTYDLQVNGALANRVILYSDGKVSTTFTFANDGSPFQTRGAGYVHYDGSSWSSSPTKRLEPLRSGWSNIGTVTIDGKEREFVVSHHASASSTGLSGGLYIMLNDAVGSSNFTVIEELDVAKDGPLWPRAVGQGSYIHIYTAATTGGKFQKEGIDRPNMYYRYDAAAEKWLDKEVLLPGYDSTRVASGRSDSYMMDANGSAIAIISGGSGQDLFLWKSTDNGDNWAVSVVDSFPIPAWAGNDDFTDTFETNSGSVGVVLDENDVAHVFYNRNRVTEDAALVDSTWSYFPGTNGIVYWNESNPDSLYVIARMIDLDNDDIATPGPDQTTRENGAQYSNNTLACFPSAGIAADGTIYMVYSAPTETQFSPDGMLYRDVYIVYSEDGGKSWSDPQTIIDNYSEDVFAGIARDVDDNIHIVWQRDDIPGTNLTNGHAETLNKIMYAAVPTSLIKDKSLAPLRSGIEAPSFNSFSVSNAYPNPVSSQVSFDLEMTENAAMTVQLKNVLGQTIISENFGTLSQGNQTLSINTSNLSAGVYVYTLVSGNSQHTGEIIVE